jgi:hypothetical protein
MFAMRGLSKFKVMKTIVRERRKMFDPNISSMEETVVQTLCLSDPYAMMTATNMQSSSSSYLCRLVVDLFFDQQAHLFAHSSDILSLFVLMVIVHVKRDADRRHI